MKATRALLEKRLSPVKIGVVFLSVTEGTRKLLSVLQGSLMSCHHSVLSVQCLLAMFRSPGFPRISWSFWIERFSGKTAASVDEVMLVSDCVLSPYGVVSLGSPRTVRFPWTSWTTSKHQNSLIYLLRMIYKAENRRKPRSINLE